MTIKRRFVFISLFLLSVLLFGLVSFTIDSVRINNGLNSILSFPITTYKDGGTIYRVGVGYGVYEWRRLTNRTINNMEISGEGVGNEIVVFPKCYFVIFSHTIEPTIDLHFEQY